MNIEWTDGSEIRVRITGGVAVISANREGLLYEDHGQCLPFGQKMQIQRR